MIFNMKLKIIFYNVIIMMNKIITKNNNYIKQN